MIGGDPRQLLDHAQRCLEELRSLVDSSMQDAFLANATDMVARLETVKVTIERSAQLLAELSVMLLGGF